MASSFDGIDEPGHLLLPVLSLREVCLFPGASLAAGIGRPAALQAVEMAQRTGGRLLAAAQMDPAAVLPGSSDLHAVGTVAQLAGLDCAAGTDVRVELDGRRRARIVSLIGTQAQVAEVEPLDEGDPGDEWGPAVEALARYLHAHAELRAFLDKQRRSQEPMAWVNLACQHLPITATARQKLLACNALERCLKISRGLDALLRKEQAT